MVDLPSRVRHKLRSLWGAAWHRGKTASAPAVRTTRRILIEAGLPLRKRFLVLTCMTGAETSGLFTEFLAVVGALGQHQRWQSIYAGLSVDYGDEGLYYDPLVGLNWWTYYFEPIDIGARDHALVTTVDPHQHDMLTYQAAAMSRPIANALISQYVRPTPRLNDILDAYRRDHFEGAFVIGVHYRGTDKHEEAPPVPYEHVVTAIRDAVRVTAADPFRVFVATDDQPFLDFMIERFPGLLYRPMFRSKDGRPIDVTNDDANHAKGEDAVIDCLLLSRTDYLIRTASNLSLCSTFFNAEVPDVLLNRPYYSPGS